MADDDGKIRKELNLDDEENFQRVMDAIYGKSIYDDPDNVVGVVFNYHPTCLVGDPGECHPEDYDTEDVHISELLEYDEFYQKLDDAFEKLDSNLFHDEDISRKEAIEYIDEAIQDITESLEEESYNKARLHAENRRRYGRYYDDRVDDDYDY